MGGVIQVSLAMGDNTLTIPTGCIGALIVPDTESAVTKTIKGNAADVGVTMRADYPFMLSFPDAAVDFIVTAGAAEDVAVHWL